MLRSDDELKASEKKIDQEIFYFQSLFGFAPSKNSSIIKEDSPARGHSYYASKNEII